MKQDLSVASVTVTTGKNANVIIAVALQSNGEVSNTYTLPPAETY